MTVQSRLGALAAGQQHVASHRAASAKNESPFGRYIETARTAERSARERIEHARKAREKNTSAEAPDDPEPASGENSETAAVQLSAESGERVQPTAVVVAPLTGVPERPIVVVGEAAGVREEAESVLSNPVSKAEAQPPGNAGQSDTQIESTPTPQETPVVEPGQECAAAPLILKAGSETESAEVEGADRDVGATSAQPRPTRSESGASGSEVEKSSRTDFASHKDVQVSVSDEEKSTDDGNQSQRRPGAENSVLQEKIRITNQQVREDTGQTREAAGRGAAPGVGAKDVARAAAGVASDSTPDKVATTVKATVLSSVEASHGSHSDPGTAIGKFLLADDTGPVNAPPAGDGAPVSRFAPREAPVVVATKADSAPSAETSAAASNQARSMTGPDLIGAARLLAASGNGGWWHTTLQLDPPSLGRMTLEIRMHQEAMTLRVSAEAASVGRLVESRMDELRDALAVHGIRVDRAEVVVRSDAAAGQDANPHSRHAHEGQRGDNSTNSYFGSSGNEHSGDGPSRWFGGGDDANNWSWSQGAYVGSAAAADNAPMILERTPAIGDRSVDLWA